MPKMDVINQEGKVVGSAELKDEIFGIEPNQQCMYDAVVMQLASRRQGTHCTKGRSEVSGGGRKPWRQKGTGRARQGSIRATQWRGGGTVFGPKPRDYGYRLNRKVRRLALKSVLSEKVNENAMSVLDQFAIEAPKTKTFNQIIAAINAPKKTLFVVSESEDYTNAMLSMRNIPTMMMLTAERINVFDIMNANQIVFTQAAVRDVEEALGDIIIRPIITEKSMRYMDADNKITFEVAKGTNKVQIAQAVKAIFGVDVEKVNIINVKPKTKRVGRYVGKTKAIRKAIVKIKAGQEIDLFGEKNEK